ncbi:GumC family protein [Aureliella helgolandensis]|uniref:Chromosome partition protein Smc n=1 Tax=Aureliella helgolandensis TaxID=2527968 RepID=A0A518G919_9BACT|nr:hypothetical protein [Aureliella helgolandensis]QDV25094.1 Chromosome partition protein Smc [Aureliella helgolandensis]
MNAPQVTNQQLLSLLRTYWQWRAMWIASTLLFGAIGLFYVVFLKSDLWVASQGFIVRDEANGAVMRLGRFESQTEMKAAQETILEMARNPMVVRTALEQVGPEPGLFSWFSSSPQPVSASAVDGLARDGIEVRAPRGAELGTTEVIYLDVKQSSPERARKINVAICDALEHHLQQVRESRADAVVGELSAATASARESLQEATQRLQRMEADAGADLSDLRGLTDTNSGGSANRQMLDAIKSELRQAELARQQISSDLNLAIESYENPDQLLVAPSNLLNSQPGLKRLREGLADATITTSQLKGRYFEVHPKVISALETEQRIRDQLRQELSLSVETLRKELEIATGRNVKLRSQQTQLESRLERLAAIRASYGNATSEVRSRNEQLQAAEGELAQARAARQAALTSSLITRLDEPLVGESPIGPGRATILAGALVSGLFFGLGIVFLLSPNEGGIKFGRRKSDHAAGRNRRASDRADSLRPAAASTTSTPVAANANASKTPAARPQPDRGFDSTPTPQSPLSTPFATPGPVGTVAPNPAPDTIIASALDPTLHTHQHQTH